MSDPRVLILGAPGAGKGTQSKRVAEEFGVQHITTGDILRANKDMETDYGTPREYMDAGELVPDAVVNEIVEKEVGEADGFILDGYPRNLDQAEFLAAITDLDAVLYLDVSESELTRRLTGRRVCSECGDTYHVEFSPPDPPYPPEARAAGVTGRVLLEILVLRDGSTEVVEVLKDLPHGCTDVAIATARQWRWRPALRNGSPVEATGTIWVSFGHDQPSNR